MGGGYYERDDAPDEAAAANVAVAPAAAPTPHEDCDPKNVLRGGGLVCASADPVVVALDLTGSMGQWTQVIYAKMPMFYGQLLMQGYLQDPSLSFAGVGDLHQDADCDLQRHPALQVSAFQQGVVIDQSLRKFCYPVSGNGNGRESYELAAYLYAHHCAVAPGGRKGFIFFTADEGYWPDLSAESVRQVLGVDPPAGVALDTKGIFKALRQKFHVFMVHKPCGYTRPSDAEIVAEWAKVVGEERILELTDPKAVVDVMLGAIAVTVGNRSLADYEADMRARGQTDERLVEVQRALHRAAAAKAD